MEVRFAQSALENPTLDTAFKPQFNRFLETGFGFTDSTALRYDADLRACRNATISGVAPHKCLKIDFESYRFDHRCDFRSADAMPDAPSAQRELPGAVRASRRPDCGV